MNPNSPRSSGAESNNVECSAFRDSKRDFRLELSEVRARAPEFLGIPKKTVFRELVDHRSVRCTRNIGEHAVRNWALFTVALTGCCPENPSNRQQFLTVRIPTLGDYILSRKIWYDSEKAKKILGKFDKNASGTEECSLY